MQLSIIASIPQAQPTPPYVPQDPGAGAGAGGFAQLLPGPNPSSSQSGQPAKKPELSSTASEEATAALYSGWMAALYPQVPPSADADRQSPAPVAAAGFGAGLAGMPVANGVSAWGGGTSPSRNTPNASAALPGAPGAGQPAAAGQAPSWNAFRTPDVAQATAPRPPAGGPVSRPAPAPSASPSAPAAATIAQQDLDPAPAGALQVNPVHGARGAPRSPGAPGAAGAEKIAAQIPRTGSSPNGVSRGPDKKILSADNKTVTDRDDSVGTGVAKVNPAMPTAAQTDRQPSALAATVQASGAAVSPQNAPAEPQAAASQAGVAQRAVEAALSAAEIFNAGGHKAVNLQFSMGNTDLSLRVELRNGEVHTTFRTDSADLRSDLAHEWQSANPGSGGSLRLAEPIFTSSGSANLAASGENASHQRGNQAPADTPQQASASAGPSTSQASAPSEADTQVQSPISLATSLHLQAFA
jgi:hypothetical protein